MACGDSKSAPSTYTHKTPAFALDAPGGWKAGAPSDGMMGAKTVNFSGGRASHSLMVTYKKKPRGDAANKRDVYKQVVIATDKKQKVVAEGKLPNGGGVWLETDRLGGLVLAWLDSGDHRIECMANGSKALLKACKSLRLPTAAKATTKKK